MSSERKLFEKKSQSSLLEMMKVFGSAAAVVEENMMKEDGKEKETCT